MCELNMYRRTNRRRHAIIRYNTISTNVFCEIEESHEPTGQVVSPKVSRVGDIASPLKR